MHLVFALLAGWTPYETAAGTPLHWLPDRDTPVLVGRSPETAPPDAEVLATATEALARWMAIDCGDVIDHRPSFAAPITTDATLVEDDHNVSIVWITSAVDWANRGFGSTELARTAVIHRTQSGEIVDSDIALNGASFAFSAASECTPDVYDLPSTLTHELGHVMGLDHSTVATATMAAKVDAGVCDKRELDPDDEEGFCAIYTEPRPPEPDPGPEPEPRPEVVEVEPSPKPRKDDGCATGGSNYTTMVVLLALTRARRASAPRRR